MVSKKVPNVWAPQNYSYIEYCAMENCYGKKGGAHTFSAFSPDIFLLSDNSFLDFYGCHTNEEISVWNFEILFPESIDKISIGKQLLKVGPSLPWETARGRM
jgi:hypothetical protein